MFGYFEKFFHFWKFFLDFNLRYKKVTPPKFPRFGGVFTLKSLFL